MSLALGRHRPTFYIDTRDRIPGGTPSNFQYIIPIDPSQSYDQVALVQFIGPKSFYNVASNNNSFELFYTTSIGINNVIIPLGNYNVYSFIKPLQDALNTASQALGQNNIFQITFNELTFKYEYRVVSSVWTDSVVLQPIFKFNNRIHLMLGFSRESSNAFTSDTLMSSFQLNFQFTKYINIKSSICTNLTNLDGSNTDTLQRIPIKDTPDGSKIIYETVNLEESSRSLVSSRSNIFKFVLVDDHNEEINMNNGESKFVIMLYHHNPFYEMSINQLQIEAITEQLKEKKVVGEAKQLETIQSET